MRRDGRKGAVSSARTVLVAALLTAGRASGEEPATESAQAPAAPALVALVAPPAASAGPRVVVSGYVHADWTVFRQTSQDEVNPDGQPLNEDRFVLRRARLRVAADHGLTCGAIEIDANTVRDLQVRPINAEASLKWPEAHPAYEPAGDLRPLPAPPWIMVTAGLIHTPFGFEASEVARRRPFLEQTTMSSAFFPGQYDLGLRVVGGFKLIDYALGIMNGAPIGERAFPGRDPKRSKDLIFRVGAASDLTDAVRLEGGLSGLTGRGFHKGKAATTDQLVWRDVDEDGVVQPIELQSIKGAPAEPSATFKRFGIGADVRVFVKLPVIGELALRAELVRASNLDRGLMVADPIASSHDLRELGWYVGGTQEITRWAQVGVRYDHYNPDSDATEREPFALVPRDPSLSTWSFMVAGRVPFGRLIAQYDLRQNARGRDVAGKPTTLADDSFTLRAEARF